MPEIEWGAGGYGVAWAEDRGGNKEIYFARVRADGVIEREVRVTNAAGYSNSPSLIWIGNAFALAWDDDRDDASEIYFAVLDENGNEVVPQRRITTDPAGSIDPRIAWTGSEYGLTWSDYRHGSPEVYFARLDTMGNRIGSEIRITNATGASQQPDIVWANGHFYLGWQDGREGDDEVYVQRLNGLGETAVPAQRLTSTDNLCTDVNIAWAGSRLAVVWGDFRSGVENVYLAMLDESLNRVRSDVLLSDPMVESGRPSAVWTGTELAVVWQNGFGMSTRTDPRLDRVNEAGDAVGFDVLVTDTPGRSINADVVWTGDEFAVAWSDDRDGETLEIYIRELRPGDCETDDDCAKDAECVAFECLVED